MSGGLAVDLLVDFQLWWIAGGCLVDCWWMSGGLLVDCWWMLVDY